LFKAVFARGITVQSKAIEWAEARCTALDDRYNELMFLLLGDPEMRIRRTQPTFSSHWTLLTPSFLPSACPGGCLPTPVDIVVTLPGGLPAPGVQVSLYKALELLAPADGRALPSALPEEFQDNRYTGPDGAAHFLVPPLNVGTLWVTVNDDEGNALTQPIPVTGTSSVPPPGHGAAYHLSAAPSVSRGSVRLAFGRAVERDARVALFDVTGRKV